MKILKSFNEYVGNVYDKLTILSIFRNERNKPIAHCSCECGNEKNINLYNIIHGRTRSCGCFEKSSRYGRNHTNLSVIGQKFGKLTILQDSGKKETNGSVLWKCQCDCGNTTLVSISNLQRGHTTSCGCAKQDYLESVKLNIIGMRFNFLTVVKELDKEQAKRRTYLCICKCGKETVVDGTSLTSGHTASCGCMRRSHGELFIENLLKEHHISFISEYRFENCKNKKKLPFDFYSPQHNTCIEYQGEQHYNVVDIWGGENGLKIRQNNDKIKQDFCKLEGINLIIIPYNKSKEEITESILNNLNP